MPQIFDEGATEDKGEMARMVSNAKKLNFRKNLRHICFVGVVIDVHNARHFFKLDQTYGVENRDKR